jgi:hypothetical protein
LEGTAASPCKGKLLRIYEELPQLAITNVLNR